MQVPPGSLLQYHGEAMVILNEHGNPPYGGAVDVARQQIDQTVTQLWTSLRNSDDSKMTPLEWRAVGHVLLESLACVIAENLLRMQLPKKDTAK